MTQAYVLIECHPGKGQELAKILAPLKYVKQAHFVTGPYDVIAFVEVPDLKS